MINVILKTAGVFAILWFAMIIGGALAKMLYPDLDGSAHVHFMMPFIAFYVGATYANAVRDEE